MDLPSPGNEPGSPALQADSLPAELPGKPLEGTGLQYFLRISKYSRYSAAVGLGAGEDFTN